MTGGVPHTVVLGDSGGSPWMRDSGGVLDSPSTLCDAGAAGCGQRGSRDGDGRRGTAGVQECRAMEGVRPGSSAGGRRRAGSDGRWWGSSCR
jgi:hypothetical protein